MIEQEPVGWINKHNLESIAQEGAGSVWNEPYFDSDIPLYTHPMHELTDEEILEVFDGLHSTFEQGFSCLQFARALLKKAREK